MAYNPLLRTVLFDINNSYSHMDIDNECSRSKTTFNNNLIISPPSTSVEKYTNIELPDNNSVYIQKDHSTPNSIVVVGNDRTNNPDYTVMAYDQADNAMIKVFNAFGVLNQQLSDGTNVAPHVDNVSVVNKISSILPTLTPPLNSVLSKNEVNTVQNSPNNVIPSIPIKEISPTNLSGSDSNISIIPSVDVPKVISDTTNIQVNQKIEDSVDKASDIIASKLASNDVSSIQKQDGSSVVVVSAKDIDKVVDSAVKEVANTVKEVVPIVSNINPTIKEIEPIVVIAEKKPNEVSNVINNVASTVNSVVSDKIVEKFKGKRYEHFTQGRHNNNDSNFYHQVLFVDENGYQVDMKKLVQDKVVEKFSEVKDSLTNTNQTSSIIPTENIVKQSVVDVVNGNKVNGDSSNIVVVNNVLDRVISDTKNFISTVTNNLSNAINSSSVKVAMTDNNLVVNVSNPNPNMTTSDVVGNVIKCINIAYEQEKNIVVKTVSGLSDGEKMLIVGAVVIGGLFLYKHFKGKY